MHSVLVLASTILLLSSSLPEKSDSAIDEPSSTSYQLAAEETPSIFTERNCFGGFRFPGKPGSIDPAKICEAQPDLCPPTGPPPPSCMCSPPRPGALLGGQHVSLPVSFDIEHTFVGRTTWSALNGSWSDHITSAARYLNAGPDCRHYVISYPGVVGESTEPFSVLSGRLASCAAGDFNHHYVSYGRALKAAGINHGMILRIGWEWNIGTNPGMSPKDKKGGVMHAELIPSFKSCFRNIVTSMREGCPDCNLMFDYNSNGTINNSLMREGYPGDDVVDIISIEAYDNSGSKTDPVARWAAREAKLNMARDFAKERRKYTAFPEWGVLNCNIRTIPCSDGLLRPSFTPGDNPYFVQKMCEYGKNPDNNVYYSIYFGGSDHSYPWHNLSHPLNAQSGAAFLRYCGCEMP